MKILIVTWFFPPANTIAGVRLGGLARHLNDRGDQVRVITADALPYPQTLPLTVDPETVIRTPAQQDPAHAGIVQQSQRRPRTPRKSGPLYRFARGLKGALEEQWHFPDRSRTWIPGAVQAGQSLCRTWQPDLVFASGPPFSTLLAAYRISRPAGLPLVCEFRDRWWDDPYYPPTWLRARRERWLERRIARYASALTTVSEPWADAYRARYGKPVGVIYNGADQQPSTGAPACHDWQPQPGHLEIVYTGSIYPGRRDPAPLFAALASNRELRSRVRVTFFGTAPHHVAPIASAHGVTDNVSILPPVSHADAAQLQRMADVLLLMQWNDPREQGNVPGKFFEYLGAGRPILLLGLAGGVPDTLLRERDAGVLANAPEEIARQLTRWLRQKDETGRVPATPNNAAAGFARAEQFEKLACLLHSLSGERQVGGNPAGYPVAGFSA